MCNDFGNRVPYDDYLRAFSQTRIPVHWPKAASNLEPRDDIWPTDTAPVIRQTDVGHEFIQLRRGFPPATLKGSPIINFRSEKRRFPVGRLPGAGIAFFRVHRHEIAEAQVAVHQNRRALVLLRRPVAADAGRAGCGPSRYGRPNPAPTWRRSRPADGHPGTHRLVGLARSDPARSRAAAAVAGG